MPTAVQPVSSRLNCPEGAIRVDSGVGCAAAMMWSALRGKKEIACGNSA